MCCGHMQTFLVIRHVSLTHRSRLTHLDFSKQRRHWFRQRLASWSATSYYLNQCWHIVNWTLGNTSLWNLNQNIVIFIEKIIFKTSSVKCRPFCLALRCQSFKCRDISRDLDSHFECRLSSEKVSETIVYQECVCRWPYTFRYPWYMQLLWWPSFRLCKCKGSTLERSWI